MVDEWTSAVSMSMDQTVFCVPVVVSIYSGSREQPLMMSLFLSLLFLYTNQARVSFVVNLPEMSRVVLFCSMRVALRVVLPWLICV